MTPGRVLQGRFGRWRPLAAAAALAAGLLLAVGVWRTEVAPQAPTYREARHEAIRSLLPAGQALPRQDAVLRWSPLAGAASYDVRVTTEDLFQTVASAKGTTATELRVPAAPSPACRPAPSSSGRWTPSVPTARARPRQRSRLRFSNLFFNQFSIPISSPRHAERRSFVRSRTGRNIPGSNTLVRRVRGSRIAASFPGL